MADVPLLAMLPLAIGLLAEGRTRMLCQVSKQVTPLLLAVVTVQVICAALLDVIAAEEPLARALMFLFLGPVPADLSTLTVAAVPMSRPVAPSREPEPPVRASATLILAGSPTAEVLPNLSTDLTTGCVAKGEPVRETPPGNVVNTNWAAADGPTTMLPEVAPGRALAVKLSVMVLARL